MNERQASSLKGPRLVACLSAAMALLFLGRLLANGLAEEGVRAVVRSSAQTSLLLLCTAFAASSLRALWPTPATRWLLVNRRYIGVSMGISHFVHFLSLIALALVSDFVPTTTTLVFGGLGFAFCFAMALTSSNAAVAALGARNWRILHKVGGYYLWFIFFQSYVPRMLAAPVYAIPVAILVTVMGLRIAAYRQQQRPARVGALANG